MRGQIHGDERRTDSGEHTMQHIDDVLQICTPGTCLILLINVTPTDLVEIIKAIGKVKKNQALSRTPVDFVPQPG